MYYRLDSEGSLNGHKTASFLAITPVYMALEMEHTKVAKFLHASSAVLFSWNLKKLRQINFYRNLALLFLSELKSLDS